MKKLFIVSLLLSGLFAQAQLGIGTTNPNVSSMLDITSTTKGFLLPRMTTTERTAIASPATGLQVYDITTNSLWYYNGTIWIDARQDLRIVGTNSHVTSDAGVGSNGTGLGSGINNVAIGQGSLSSAATALQNVAIGSFAMASATTGGYNVALGYNALNSNVTSNDNVGIGTAAGNNITSGARNTTIGNYTQVASPTGSYQLNISNAIFGTGLTGSVGSPAGSIGIGTSAPDGTAVLDVASTTKGFLAPRMTTAQRTAIASPAAGLQVYDTTTNSLWYYNGTTWITSQQDLRMVGINNHVTADAGAGGTGTSGGTGSGNIGIGSGALYSITTAGNLIAIGPSALRNNTTGIQNLAVGTGALSNNTTGVNNNAVGWSALGNTTTGVGNVGFGYAAVGSNTTGSNNIGIGNLAVYGPVTGNNNVGVGASVLSIATGSDNTAFGNSALNNTTTGNSNTAIGANAGSNLTTGAGNIALGYNTNFASATANNQLNIGNAIFGTGLSGSVGTPAGNIGIGTASPSTTLHVNGVITATKIQGPSDSRFKKNIKPIENALEKVLKLGGYTYDWKDASEFPGQTLGKGHDMGVIAQEVEKQFPEAVTTNSDGFKAVSYTELVPALIEAIKKQQSQIEILQAEVAKLKK